MKTTHYKFNTGKIKNNSSFRAVQISDLHKKCFGPENRELSEAVTSLKPDAVFITGDMVSRSVKDISNLKPLLENLSRSCTVYYSLGNHETDMETVNPVLHAELMECINRYCILLDNRSEYIQNENMKIKVSGLTVYQECYKKDGHYRNLRTVSADDVRSLLKTESETECINILLAHNPMFFSSYAEYGSEIILSGHVHGGCVRLPLIGGVLSPERKFFPKYCSGEYKMKNSSMIVSCGLGKFRMFNPPEITVIELS